MVALTVGGLAISTFYGVARETNRFFQEQHRITSLQDRLRHAMAQVKRDFQRAGYLSASNLATMPDAKRCRPPGAPLTTAGNRIAGIMQYNADFPGQLLSGLDPALRYSADANVRADRVWLLGNFETSSMYQGVDFDPTTPATVTLTTQTTYAARRDFGAWQLGTPAILDAAAFNAAFRINRPIVIGAPNGTRHFALPTAISTLGFAAGTGIVFNIDPPATGPLGVCQLGGGWIAPLEVIEYQVLPIDSAGTAAAARNAALRLDAADPVPQLHRREIDLTTGAPMAGGEDRVVLEYVVAFRLGFINDAGTLTNQDQDNISWVENSGNANINPETIRAVRVLLAARSAGQDVNFALGQNPLQSFQMDRNRRGAARVRSMRADIFIPNLALK